MKLISKATAALLAAMLVGCASYPSDPAQQAAYFAKLAQSELNKGNLMQGLSHVETAIKMPGGSGHVKSFLATDKGASDKLIAAIKKRIAGIISADQAKSTHAFLKQIFDASVMSSADQAQLSVEFDSRIIAGNESGALAFMMGNYVFALKALSSEPQLDRIYRRTLKYYADNGKFERDMQSMLAYVRTLSESGKSEFHALLPHLNIRGDELLAVGDFSPEFAAKRRAEITLNAFLVVKNADRLFADDLVAQLSKEIRGVTWLPISRVDAVELVVERVRSVERELPASTRTVTYSQGQVDLLLAALLMPRNASYQFELRTGGAEIEYGYVVSFWKGGQRMAEEVVRGKLSGVFNKCENPRVVNVFGGVTSAEFVANDDMRSACSGKHEVSMDTLRTQLIIKIVDQVREFPQFSKVHSMN